MHSTAIQSRRVACHATRPSTASTSQGGKPSSACSSGSSRPSSVSWLMRRNCSPCFCTVRASEWFRASATDHDGKKPAGCAGFSAALPYFCCRRTRASSDTQCCQISGLSRRKIPACSSPLRRCSAMSRIIRFRMAGSNCSFSSRATSSGCCCRNGMDTATVSFETGKPDTQPGPPRPSLALPSFSPPACAPASSALPSFVLPSFVLPSVPEAVPFTFGVLSVAAS